MDGTRRARNSTEGFGRGEGFLGTRDGARSGRDMTRDEFLGALTGCQRFATVTNGRLFA